MTARNTPKHQFPCTYLKTGHKCSQLAQESYLITNYRIKGILKDTKTVKWDAYAVSVAVSAVSSPSEMRLGPLFVVDLMRQYVNHDRNL